MRHGREQLACTAPRATQLTRMGFMSTARARGARLSFTAANGTIVDQAGGGLAAVELPAKVSQAAETSMYGVGRSGGGGEELRKHDRAVEAARSTTCAVRRVLSGTGAGARGVACCINDVV